MLTNPIKLFLPLLVSITPTFVNAAVLDPALYLYPSPPLSSTADHEYKEQWNRASRSTHLVASKDAGETTTVTSADSFESMDSAETFWPRLRSIDYALKQVHIPVTFSLSGNYGGYRGNTGVIGSSYASVGSPYSYGKSALAGSGYGSYGSSVRVYGGNSEPAWSGWRNGKWGHYGKG